jgi:hypothetical protein
MAGETAAMSAAAAAALRPMPLPSRRKSATSPTPNKAGTARSVFSSSEASVLCPRAQAAGKVR